MQRPPYSQWRRTAAPLALAFVSLVAALAIWIAVTDAENPTRESDFTAGIEVKPVNVPDGLAVARIQQATVKLRVSTDEKTLKKLTTADFSATVDLGGAEGTSDQVVIANVVGKRDVEIVNVTPATVSVVLEPEIAKQVPVQINRVGSVPQGYNVTLVDPSPNRVRVTGAGSLIQQVESANADVNLTGTRVSIDQQYTLVARDARGFDIPRVHVDPNSASVRINVTQQDVTLTLSVAPQVQGGVADGYSLVAIVTDPPAVTVSGPIEVLQALSFISTESIDASGLRADATRSVHLSLPARVQANRDTVTVQLKVQPQKGELLVQVVPEVTGLGEGLTANLQTTSLTIRIRGDLPVLRALQAGQVRAVVNVANLTEGAQVVNPTLSVPANLQVVSVEPAQVVLVLRK